MEYRGWNSGMGHLLCVSYGLYCSQFSFYCLILYCSLVLLIIYALYVTFKMFISDESRNRNC